LQEYFVVHFFFVCLKNYAQITLENNFSNENIFRVYLEFDGEKYATFLVDSQKIKLYNTDHTLWKEFNFNIPQESEFEIYNLSQGLLNEDSLIEVTYGYRFSTNEGFTVKIKTENEFNLLSVSEVWSSNILFERTLEKVSFLKMGSETKLAINSHEDSSTGTRIYSLPGLQLEHTYINFNYCELEIDGPKYVELNYNYNPFQYNLLLYNLDHSLFKNTVIDLNSQMPPSYSGSSYFAKIFDISQHKVNNDNLIEVLLNIDYNDNINELQNVVCGFNENGTTLFVPITVGISGGGSIMEVDNNFFLLTYISNSNGFPGQTSSVTTNMLSMPNFQIVQSFPYAVQPIVLDGIGTKFYTLNLQAPIVNFYNLNHTFWKSLTFPVPTSNSTPEIFKISTTYFDNDTAIEIMYRTIHVNNGILHETGFIYKEDFGIVLRIDSCSYFYIDKQAGLSHKIFANISTFDDSNYFGTKIYSWREGINRFTSIPKTDNALYDYDFEIFPNPSNNLITIYSHNTNAEKLAIDITDTFGKNVYKFSDANIDFSFKKNIDTSELQSGLYFIRITKGSQSRTKKLLKN
jgi:hypothetical protein